MSQTPNDPERTNDPERLNDPYQPERPPAGEPGTGASPLTWEQQQPGAARPPEQPRWSTPPQPSTQPHPAEPPPPGAQPPPHEPQWGDQPQPAGGQWGAQPQWGGQPGAGWGPAPVPPGAKPWSVKPPNGIIPLRPLALGELYDGAFQAIRSNPRTMIGISALVVLIVTLIGAIPQAASLQAIGSLGTVEDTNSITLEQVVGTVSGALIGLLIPQLLTALAITVLSGMLIVAVSAAVLGRRTPLAALWAQVGHRVLALIGLSLITSITPLILFALCFVPGSLVLASGQGEVVGVILLVLGFPVGVVLCGWLWVKWSLAAPALLLENQGVGGALGRAWVLARGTFGRLLGILLLTGLLVGVLGTVVSAPFSAIAGVFQPPTDNPLAIYASFTDNLVRMLITGIGQIIAGAVLYPFSAAVTALLYVDVRMRREGLDVELMRAVSGQS